MNISKFITLLWTQIRAMLVYTLLTIISCGTIAQLIDFENGIEIELSESGEMETNSNDENVEDDIDEFLASLLEHSESLSSKLSAHRHEAFVPEIIPMEIPSPPPEQAI